MHAAIPCGWISDGGEGAGERAGQRIAPLVGETAGGNCDGVGGAVGERANVEGQGAAVRGYGNAAVGLQVLTGIQLRVGSTGSAVVDGVRESDRDGLVAAHVGGAVGRADRDHSQGCGFRIPTLAWPGHMRCTGNPTT